MSELFSGAGRAADYDEDDLEEAGPIPVGPVERAVTEASQPRPPVQLLPEGYAPHGQVETPAELEVLGHDGASFTNLAEQARPDLVAPGPAIASWGWRGRLVRLTGGLLHLRASQAEQAHLEAERLVRQTRWARSVNVLVANKCGGVGKTTSSLILSGILAQLRGGSVATFEASDAPGSLDKRAEGAAGRGMGELVREAGSVQTAGGLGGYVSSQTSLADVIGSSSDRPILTGGDVIAVRTILDRHYRMTVADSGNSPHSDAHSRALETADVLVIPTLLTSVSVLDALAALQAAAERGPKGRALAERAVVVVNHDGRPEPAAAAAREQLQQLVAAHPGVVVLEVPYDSHINAGGQISLAFLTTTSRHAWTQVAAAVVEKLHH